MYGRVYDDVMLTLYRRHRPQCSRVHDRYWRRCDCPMWVEGTANKSYMRKSLGTQSWEHAARLIADLERPQESEPINPHIDLCLDSFLFDVNARGLAKSTLVGYRVLTHQFRLWCRANNIQFLKELTVVALRPFLGSLPISVATKQIRRMQLAMFFEYCVRSNWITSNPVRLLSLQNVRVKPTEPLQRDEFERLIAQAVAGSELRGALLLLRWSGLRLLDGITLERSRVDNQGRLLLYQQKTGHPVFIPLPGNLLEVLSALPGDRYFIWDGRETPEAVGNRIRRHMKTAAVKAGITKRVHPHMLRDTFAIELLLAGVPLDQVSMLLGHTSIITTQRHYAPWVKARQDQLSESVRSSWLGA